MLNKIRNFSKTIFAKVLLVIIIIPFVFWGMGGVFSSGSTNTIVKINNHIISTQDFIDYLNNSKISSEIIKKNIDNNVLEELLSELVSKTLLNLEMKKLNLNITDISLSKRIKQNKNFLDENNNFSRIKYEKFLLSNNISATIFEERLKTNELQKQLFSYVSGGIKTPYFLINKTYKEQNKIINLEYINLEKVYKKKNQFSEKEVNLYIKKNEDDLKQDFIDFNYAKITPQELIGINEFNKLFFEKIDEIESKISEGASFNEIVNSYKLKEVSILNFNINKNSNQNNEKKEIYQKIYKNRKINETQLIEENDYYLLYQVKNIKNVLPDYKNKEFYNKILEILYLKEKYKYNQELLNKINNKNFNHESFLKIAKLNQIELKNIKIKSIRDNNNFNIDSVKLLYSLPIKSFSLISDDQKNIYLSKIKDYKISKITKESENYKTFDDESVMIIKNDIYSSYDYLLNKKYKVKINQKTLERVKNYFR